jgi:thiazole biosynthesis enzyme
VDGIDETDVSQAILDAYHAKFVQALRSDVIVVGAGPSGLVAAGALAEKGLTVVLLERRLSPGGGIWGGGLGMNEVVVQAEALPLLDRAGIRHQEVGHGLHTVQAAELASALCLGAVRAGATFLNLMAAEDVCVHRSRLTGVVANRSRLTNGLPIDPITFSAKAVVDATGHEAVLVQCLRRRRLLRNLSRDEPVGEGPMDAAAGEQFVVENVSEVFPGLWVTGMSVCASLGGPRMGPIFGGMLRSGAGVAEQVAAALVEQQTRTRERKDHANV